MHRIRLCRRRLKLQQGSVSVFLIFIFSFIFMFMAIFIDYARIIAFQFQTEQLAKSGVRSAMSSYDTELQAQYGLFVQGESDQNELFADSIRQSVQIQSLQGKAFRLLDTELVTSSVSPQYALGQYDVFERQIFETMKYKAPIDFTMEIVNKLKPLSGMLQEASQTTDVLARLQKLYDKRERLLDRIIEAQVKAGKDIAVKQLDVRIARTGQLPSLTDTSISSMASMADIAIQYADYVEKKRLDANRNEDEWPIYTQQTSDYERYSDQLSTRFQQSVKQAADGHQTLLNLVIPYFAAIRTINEQMKRIIVEAEQQQNEDYSTVGGQKSAISDLKQESEVSSKAIRDIRGKLDQLLLDEADIRALEQEVQQQIADMIHVEQRADTFRQAVLSSIPGSSGSSSLLKQTVRHLYDAIDVYLMNYVRKGDGNKLMKRQQAIAAYRTSDKQRKWVDQQAKMKLQKWTKLLKKLRQAAKQGQAVFDTVAAHYTANITFNRELEQQVQEVEAQVDPVDAGKQSMALMDGLYQGMTAMLTKARDEVYRNEYAASYFDCFDTAGLKSLLAGGDVDQQLERMLTLNNQQLEYIVYGFHHPGSNLAAAYGELFGIRLAIRTMEGFVQAVSKGHPLLILSTALLYGVERAIADMLELVNQGSIPLSKYVSVRLSYKDYLRLFLLLHTSRQHTMSRMLALIQWNTGVNPNERYTYVEGQVQAALSLWFLPGAIRLLRTTQLIPHGEVEGATYRVTKQAVFAY